LLVTRVEKLTTLAPAPDGRFRVFAFDLEVGVEGTVDARHGMVLNLAELKETLRREIVAPLAGRCLDGTNGAPDLRTPEALVRAIWGMLGARFGAARVARVRLVGDRSTVETRGGDELDLTRTYEFSAAHRLHSSALSDSENVRVFGKCNNPRGHGHNYVLQVTLRGEPGGSGEVLDATAFDRIVASEIVDRWDHKNLNEDVAEFADRNPTAEEIARVAWSRLAAPLDDAANGRARLHRIRVQETERNHVEYHGD
jgi:6-pyruvoyltetrahydropterin/6-carboxytetrahydropterin synthase